MLLQDQLDAITSRTRALVQPERLAGSERAVAELFASGIEEGILSVGAEAPGFALAEARSGQVVRSSDLLALGPVVLKFFRGRWDPYCVTELEAWRELYPRVRELGGLMVAVSSADGSTERLSRSATCAYISGAVGPWMRGGRAVWPGIQCSRGFADALPLHPGQHPVRQCGG